MVPATHLPQDHVWQKSCRHRRTARDLAVLQLEHAIIKDACKRMDPFNFEEAQPEIRM